MFQSLRNFEARLFLRLRKRKPSTKLEANSFRILLLLLASVGLAIVLPGGLGGFFQVLARILLCALGVCLLVLMLRWVFSRILWTVRSRLIVTCLLMGLAPIVLFGTLAAIAAYVFCGQFATSIAFEGIHDDLAQVQQRSLSALAMAVNAPKTRLTLTNDDELATPMYVTTWYDGKAVQGGEAKEPGDSPFAGAALPGWLHAGFKGMVAGADNLYLCAANGAAPQGHVLILVACSPFRDREVAALAEGLGSVSVSANFDIPSRRKRHKEDDEEDPAPGPIPREFTALRGGKLKAPVNFLDVRVYFSAPLHTTDWQNGQDDSTWLMVVSRPAVLYNRLFASSVGAGTYVHLALITTAIVFGVLELLACVMAFALSRTITRSIADMYEATQEIDRGNLDHRIPVRRKDQLATLAASFNGMAASLKGLLKEQREKDRMQNELNIAQEVQNNLFPHTSIQLPDFEVYGVCEPARTIGGDYYDFIPFGASQLYLSLGDISGKGISAALLMASLHSAVRAYRSGESSEVPEFDEEQDAEFTVSPGRLLALLNQHLYSSTQPEKYATLFLACYDSATRLLTYSNGGHLPPVILSADGAVRRLDCGGSVVGLLEGLHYREATVQLSPGDVLIAYSDGLTEPERETVEFGEERLIEIVRRNQILPLPDIAARSLKAVREWIGDAEQPDDMTLVLARLS